MNQNSPAAEKRIDLALEFCANTVRIFNHSLHLLRGVLAPQIGVLQCRTSCWPCHSWQ